VRKAVAALAALCLLVALLAVSAGAGAAPAPKSYLILAKGEKLPANVAAQVQAAGGTLTSTIPQVGIAVASTTSADFKAKASKIGSVVPNVRIDLVDPSKNVVADFASPPSSGDDDELFDLQWGHDAIDAPEAWNAGERGDGVRVAVLDTGFDLDHPDLAPNIDFAASKDFTGQGLSYGLPDPFSHGTHTAGTIAAADNGLGTIGVAPEATLVLVKMLFDEGFGTFDDGIEAIVYAAGPADADVLSMSWGARVPRAGDPTDPDLDTPEEVAELKRALNLATRYAFKQGATLVASAGNDAENYDQNEAILSLPAMSDNVLAISATAPVGWAKDPGNVYLDNLASYSNYGNSLIDFAAPGGDFIYPGNENCTVAGLTRPCWVFDLVFSTGSNLNPAIATYYWSAGTSMAAPHVSGTAAIIIGANGGEMAPKAVERALRQSTDRIGSGAERSRFFGSGRVNAGNAVAP
jgi:subtilisin family serine protease